MASSGYGPAAPFIALRDKIGKGLRYFADDNGLSADIERMLGMTPQQAAPGPRPVVMDWHDLREENQPAQTVKRPMRKLPPMGAK
jgi:hypothetical protein